VLPSSDGFFQREAAKSAKLAARCRIISVYKRIFLIFTAPGGQILALLL
jgi:hypothetical protein